MNQPPDNPPRGDKKCEREARLAQALRDNLKRRKAQARARKADNAAPSAPPGPKDKEPA